MQFPFNFAVDRKFDVIGFGTNAVDNLIEVPEYPKFNSKVKLIQYQQAAGGEVATTMVGLQRLGIRASYIGRFGSDDAGKFGIQSLEAEGVDLTHAEEIGGAKTQIAFIFIDISSGERTVLWQRDEKLSYSASEVPLKAVSQAKILHLTPHDTKACIALAVEAKKKGVIVSIDIDNVFPGVEELLDYVDILVASSEFPEKLLGIKNKKSALKEIKSRFGGGIVGVTLGEAGSLLLINDTFIETPGFAVPGGCRDTTGAGDSFRVGLIYGLLKGESIESSARMANAVAALKCRAVGARAALPDQAELKNFLAESL